MPTAFYRHFASIEELGIALVDEAFASLRKVLRDLRREMDVQRVIDDSVAILVRNVRERRGHFMFIARERVGGLPAVREAIRQELGLFERELATDIARLPAMQEWSTEDLRVLANLIVGAMVETAEAIITAPPGRPDIEREVVRTAEQQLRIVVVGAANWRRPDATDRRQPPDAFSHRPTRLPSGSLKYAAKPMSPTACRSCTTVPPPVTDRLERVLEVVDVDHDVRGAPRALALQHAAVDEAGSVGPLLGSVGPGRHDRVAHLRHVHELPPEDVAVELPRPVTVVERDLEVHHSVAHCPSSRRGMRRHPTSQQPVQRPVQGPPARAQPNVIRKSRITNDASVRAPTSQPSGPSGSKVQEPRTTKARELPVSDATTEDPSSRGCHVVPEKGTRGSTTGGAPNSAEAIPGTTAETGRRPSRCSVDHSKEAISLGTAHRARPPSRDGSESTQMSVTVTCLPAVRPRGHGHGPGHQQLAVRQRAARLVVDERDAVHPRRGRSPGPATRGPQQRQPELTRHAPRRRGERHRRVT